MNRPILALPLVLFLVAFPSAGSAQVRGTAMGNLVTVISDGPFDTARNPALLALQPADHAAAAFVRYRAVDDSDIDYNSSLPISVGEPSTFNAGGVVSYSMKLSGSVLGFVFGEMAGDLVSYRESRNTFYAITEEIEKEKIFEVNPSLAVALALPLTDGSSIGFQLITAVGYKRADKTKDYLSGPIIASLDTQKTDQSLSARAGFGYSLRTPKTQAGFLLRSGTITLRKQELEYNHVEYDLAAPEISGSNSTPYKAYYTESPQFVVGGYHRLSPLVGFALEAAYMLSNTSYNRERDLTTSVLDGGSDSITPFSRNFTITTDASMQFKGGIEFNVMEGLAFTFGTGYDYRESSQESETIGRVSIRSKMEILYATLGAHYSLNQATGISVLVSGGRLKMDAKLEQESLYSIDIDSTIMIVDAGIAITTRY
ncbi:MAG TPA: hypothetical protein VLM75_07085 [Spirochaetota bacterium]|nr:hypothetical protein [Spirochaetota bacterium]